MKREIALYFAQLVKKNMKQLQKSIVMAYIKQKCKKGVVKMGIKILHPGIYTTIQDEGRFGYESLGFSPAGAMDYESYYLANQLIGNDLNTPVLEMILKGAKFQVTSNVTIG